MNRQIVSFILGTVLLVIILIFLFGIIGNMSASAVKMNNIRLVGWFSNGIESAYKNKAWDSGQHYMSLEGSNYFLFFIDKAGAKYISGKTQCNYITKSKCVSTPKTFAACETTNSFCVCVAEIKGGSLPQSDKNIFTVSKNGWVHVDSEIDYIFNKLLNNGATIDIVACKDMGYNGVPKISINFGGNQIAYILSRGFNFQLEKNSDNNAIQVEIEHNA